MTFGNVIAILISVGALYLAYAFVRTKFFKIDTDEAWERHKWQRQDQNQ